MLPLAELRADFAVARAELRDLDRGAVDLDLGAVDAAARQIAQAENVAVFHGWAAAGIVGITEAAQLSPIVAGKKFADYPKHVAKAVETLLAAGVSGPYGLALGPEGYTGVVETTENGGLIVFDHLREILGGPIVWAPGVLGAVVLSLRGGDFLFESGQDLSLGYDHHDADRVNLYLEESFTFRSRHQRRRLPCGPERVTTRAHGSRPTMRRYATGSVAPSVQSTSTRRPRRSNASASTTARRPASAAAPVSPATTPIVARSRIACSAAASSTATNTSAPADTAGQAMIETMPQFKPAMIESCGPGTSTGRPAAAERSPHAADSGSTTTIVARDAKCCTVAAASAPTPIGTTTTSGGAAASCSSISAKIVA